MLLCFSIPSTSVVLPWSTWAMMATLRMSLRVVVNRSSHKKGNPCPGCPGNVYHYRKYSIGLDDCARSAGSATLFAPQCRPSGSMVDPTWLRQHPGGTWDL